MRATETSTTSSKGQARTTPEGCGPYTLFFVEPIGAHRGMHYYDFELGEALVKAGTDLTLFTSDDTRDVNVPAPLTVEYPFRGLYRSESAKLVRGWRYLRGLLRIARAAEERRADLVHFHYFLFPPVDYLILYWLCRRGISLVLTVHDVVPFDASPFTRVWLQRIYRLADQLIVHADNNRQAILDEFALDEGKVNVIPMGPYLRFADEQALSQSVARRRLELDVQTPVVLFFGQIKTVKGLSYLIEAFRQILDRGVTARLVIAGPEWNQSFDRYARLISDLNLTGHVLTKIQFIPDEEVGLYFSAADVVALPYTELYQSAVLFMAYSFARPVVASRVGGLVEVIEEGRTGRLVPPADPVRLAEGLLSLLNDPERARAMGRRGRKLVATRYGWHQIAQKTVDVYSRALQSGPAQD